MASETIVAVFDTPAAASSAISSLKSQGVPESSIEHYAADSATAGTAGTTTSTEHKSGFWAWLTGEESSTHTDHHALYDQSVKSGSTVVTVVTDTANADKIYGILSSHDPIDLEERDAQYLSSGAYAGTQHTGVTNADRVGTTGETLALSEETLHVGKRAVDQGTTRVRRYVVERPVEEQIRLRNESVSVYRRPVADGATVGKDAFTDRTISMNETAEEAVVGKTARVVEEVGLQKDVKDRVETIRDTVRREDVEVVGPDHVGTTGDKVTR